MATRLPVPCGLLTLALLSAAAASGGGDRALSTAEAAKLLRAAPDMDPDSRRVIQRAETAYRKLRKLRTVSRDGGMVAVSLLERPRRYHHTQQLVTGQRLALAVCDGTRYYEYRERTRQYLERPAEVLDRLVLPVNVRFFFPHQSPAGLLVGLDGKPTVREYGYRYRGKSAVDGNPVERVDVSVMVRGPGGAWRSFESRRFFDAKSGLLRRAVNGGRTLEIENQLNPRLPADRFRWTPPPGALKGLG